MTKAERRMYKFSANLGFLWTELPLDEAIIRAADAGFDAVECHWPYDLPASRILQALQKAGLSMLGINARCGDRVAGEFGLAALPARVAEARRDIDEAIAYAAAINAGAVHVMAGKSDASHQAHKCYRDNLAYAANRAMLHGLTILIEPINQLDVPGYHLSYVEDAIDLIASLGCANIKLMFDCYHTQIMQGDICRRLTAHIDHIGHVQIAAVPDRGEPDAGELFYPAVLAALYGAGYQGFIGAEYRPRYNIDTGLDWLEKFKQADSR
jgi:hydroxypyruvate isomerase